MMKLELTVDGLTVPPEKLDRKVEYDLTDSGARVLWLLESLCGKWPGSILQLTRKQLQELQSMAGEDLIFRPHDGKDLLSADAPILSILSREEPNPMPLDEAKESTQGSPRGGSSGKSPETRKRPAAEERSRATPGTIDGSEHFLAIQLPSTEHSAYSEIRERLKTDRFKLEPSNRKWWLRDRLQVLEFLAAYGKKIEAVWGLVPTGNYRERTAKIRFLEPKIEVNPAESLDGDFLVTVGWNGVSDTERREAVRMGSGHIDKKDKIFLVDPDGLAKAKEWSRRAAPWLSQGGGQYQIPAGALSDAEDMLAEIEPEWVSPSEWKASVRRLNDPDAVELPGLPDSLGARLRGYQKVGVGWFWNLHRERLGGILADEMGLGKTVQSLGLIGCAVGVGEEKPSLVVCPASLVENWVREAAEFLPAVRAHGYHGASRDLDFSRLGGKDLLVTSYGTLRADRALFLKTNFATIIADEAQFFKNPSTETARVMRSLQADSRFALTGTPIENAISDLEGIGRFALPGILRSGRGTSARSPDQTPTLVRPYLLRRTKAEVLKDLPEKWESRRFVGLSEAQEELYRSIQVRTESTLSRLRSSGAKQGQLTAELWKELLRLRQVVAEPRILDADLPRETSAKSNGLMEILAEVRDGGGRMLVFSSFTQTLSWLRTDLEADGVPYCYLDGSTRNRQQIVDQFNGDDSIPVFLLSLKAGGTGLNLTGADTVVHYDPWWNPAAQAQATDRAHRIGQTRKVQSIQLIGAGTVEEKVIRLQDEKRGLLAALFDGAEQSDSVLDFETLESLLKE